MKEEYLIIQSTHETAIKMDGVFMLKNWFRTACAIIDNCDMYLGNRRFPAAAALDKKALIYFGGWCSSQLLW